MVIRDKNDENIININPETHLFRFISSKSKDIGSKKVTITLRMYLDGGSGWEDILMAEYPSPNEALAAMQTAAESIKNGEPSIDFAII